MTRFPCIDSEDLATLREHAREPGSTRSRRARNPWADAARVEFVEHWPCRGRCGQMIGITAETVEAFAILNGEAAVRGDRPISKLEAACCPACKRREDYERQAQRRPHEQRTIAGLEPGGKGRP